MQDLTEECTFDYGSVLFDYGSVPGSVLGHSLACPRPVPGLSFCTHWFCAFP